MRKETPAALLSNAKHQYPIRHSKNEEKIVAGFEMVLTPQV
jgi:hypothetical protein